MTPRPPASVIYCLFTPSQKVLDPPMQTVDVFVVTLPYSHVPYLAMWLYDYIMYMYVATV